MVVILFLACSGSSRHTYRQTDQGFSALDITFVPHPDTGMDHTPPRDIPTDHRPDMLHRDINHDSGMDTRPVDSGFDYHQVVDSGRDQGPFDPGCTPNCQGKQCGSDGCGGSCGTCKQGEECINARCVCIPDCSGKQCGPDGCGKTCGQCPSDEKCIDDQGVCGSYGPCKTYERLFCYNPNDPNGDDHEVSGNNGLGYMNSDDIDLYNCPVPTAPPHGPEVVYEFDAPQTGQVTLQFKPKADYLNAYILKGSCDGWHCHAWTHGTTSFNVTKGEHWYIVVDAVKNRTARYSMYLECSWQPTN